MCKRSSSGGLCKIWVGCPKNPTVFEELCIRTNTGKFDYSSEDTPQGSFYQKKVVAKITRMGLDIIEKLDHLGGCCGVLVKIKTMNGDIWQLNDADTPFEIKHSGSTGFKPSDYNEIDISFSGQTIEFVYG